MLNREKAAKLSTSLPKQGTIIKNDIDSITARMNAAFKINEAIQRTLTTNLSERTKMFSRFTRRAENAFSKFSFSRVPADRQKDPTYLMPTDKLIDNQKAIIKRDIAAIKDSDINHSVKLSLSAEDIRKLGLTGSSDKGSVIGNIKLDSFLAYVNSRFRGIDIFANNPIGSCTYEVQAQRKINEIKNIDNSTGSTNGSTKSCVGTTALVGNEDGKAKASQLTSEKLVKAEVNLQMSHVTSPETHLTYGIGDTAGSEKETIKNSIQTFELEGGPADSVSFHDFYRLNIAFECIWSELFDDDIHKFGKELYKEWVQLRDFTKDPQSANDIDINSLDDLRKLMNEVRNLSNIVVDNTGKKSVR